jgi:hypothetical protein
LATAFVLRAWEKQGRVRSGVPESLARSGHSSTLTGSTM